MSKDLITKAFADAEKEQQEEEIKRIKNIVQKYLEKIQDTSERKNKLDEELRLLKKDLNDLKDGRLDKIKERSEKDSKAKEVTLIIIKEIQKEYIPMKPWYSPWYVELKPDYNPVFPTSPIVYSTSTDCSVTTSGDTFATFSGGTYTVGSNTINL